jgi:hypothetical protein
MLTVSDLLVPAVLWSGAEINVSIVCASLPGFNPLLSWVSRRRASQSTSNLPEQSLLPKRLQNFFKGNGFQRNVQQKEFSNNSSTASNFGYELSEPQQADSETCLTNHNDKFTPMNWISKIRK